MTTKDGGSAFPCAAAGEGHTYLQEGMSLRDWFAGMALQGYIAAHADPNASFPESEHAAKRAYAYADAMLKAREVS